MRMYMYAAQLEQIDTWLCLFPTAALLKALVTLSRTLLSFLIVVFTEHLHVHHSIVQLCLCVETC